MAERIIIDISTGDAAFDDAPASEIARILRELAERFERDGLTDGDVAIRDVNGNRVGCATVVPS